MVAQAIVASFGRAKFPQGHKWDDEMNPIADKNLSTYELLKPIQVLSLSGGLRNINYTN